MFYFLSWFIYLGTFYEVISTLYNKTNSVSDHALGPGKTMSLNYFIVIHLILFPKRSCDSFHTFNTDPYELYSLVLCLVLLKFLGAICISPWQQYDLHQCQSLQWHHNKRHGVLKHRRLDCLLSRLFRRRSKKASKLRVTGLCVGISTVTDEFPAQRASNAENVSIWWRHHEWIKARLP